MAPPRKLNPLPALRRAVWLPLVLLAALGGCTEDNGDRTLPEVVIMQPIAGITVSGQVLIEVTASDAGGVLRVLFAAAGDDLGDDDTPPYTWDWNSVPYAGGEVSLLAAAEDRAGNLAYSEYVVVRVVAP